MVSYICLHCWYAGLLGNKLKPLSFLRTVAVSAKLFFMSFQSLNLFSWYTITMVKTDRQQNCCPWYRIFQSIANYSHLPTWKVLNFLFSLPFTDCIYLQHMSQLSNGLRIPVEPGFSATLCGCWSFVKLVKSISHSLSVILIWLNNSTTSRQKDNKNKQSKGFENRHLWTAMCTANIQTVLLHSMLFFLRLSDLIFNYVHCSHVHIFPYRSVQIRSTGIGIKDYLIVHHSKWVPCVKSAEPNKEPGTDEERGSLIPLSVHVRLQHQSKFSPSHLESDEHRVHL